MFSIRKKNSNIREIGCGTFVLMCAALCSSAQAPSGMRSLPDPLFGVTLDDVSNLSGLSTSLQSLPRMPISRVVFDEQTTPSDYISAISRLQPVSYLMGEILDSEYVNTYSPAAYAARTTQFLNAFGNQVDVWEVGNEVNGEWLGTTTDVVTKISNAWQQVSSKGKRSALTLYYNPNCWSNPKNAMIPWAQQNIPAAMKAGLGYVFVSYYETDCNNYRPSITEWSSVFEQLHAMFPNAKLGFGEIGMDNPARSGTLKKAQSILGYYYGLDVQVPGWTGGGFWWYFAEDMAPDSKPLWQTLSTAIQQSPW
jgi:hypothetical protein